MVTGRLRRRSWETTEGEKRSVTELEADEIGASLKWATAKAERTSQRGNGERSSGRERQAETCPTDRSHGLVCLPAIPDRVPAGPGRLGQQRC
jgi:single-stranded DNA-binding protein